MTAFTEPKTQKTPIRGNKSANTEEKIPFHIIESKELTQKLTPGQYSVVQSYRNMLVGTALSEKMNVAEITIGFADKWRGTDEIIFEVSVVAEEEEVMPLWDKFDSARDIWRETLCEIAQEFTHEYCGISVRRKRTHV